MSPISSETSPLKTGPSTRDHKDVTQAKKSRFHEEPEDDSMSGNKKDVDDSSASSSQERLGKGGTRYFKLQKAVQKSIPVNVKEERMNIEEEDEDDNIKVEIRSRSSETLSVKKEDEIGGAQDIKIFVKETRERNGNKRHHSACSSTSDGDGSGADVEADPNGQSNSKPVEHEFEPAVLARRQKQIEYGKNTAEYHNYIQAVPRVKREPFHPKTPNKHRKYSRRAWDGLVRQWRLNLHVWSDCPIPASTEIQGNESDEGDLNESFNSGSTAETASTSSSIATAFNVGFHQFGVNRNEIKPEIKSEEISDEEDSDEEVDKSDLDKTLTEDGEKPKNKYINEKVKKEVLSTSWGDEVNDYLEECEKQYGGDNNLF